MSVSATCSMISRDLAHLAVVGAQDQRCDSTCQPGRAAPRPPCVSARVSSAPSGRPAPAPRPRRACAGSPRPERMASTIVRAWPWPESITTGTSGNRFLRRRSVSRPSMPSSTTSRVTRSGRDSAETGRVPPRPEPARRPRSPDARDQQGIQVFPHAGIVIDHQHAKGCHRQDGGVSGQGPIGGIVRRSHNRAEGRRDPRRIAKIDHSRLLGHPIVLPKETWVSSFLRGKSGCLGGKDLSLHFLPIGFKRKHRLGSRVPQTSPGGNHLKRAKWILARLGSRWSPTGRPGSGVGWRTFGVSGEPAARRRIA